MARTTDLDIISAKIADTLLPTLNDNLKGMARASKWPPLIIEALSVQFDGQSLVVDYPDKFASEIDDLEYGKPFGLPNPVIYPFILRSEPLIIDAITNIGVDEMFEEESGL